MLFKQGIALPASNPLLLSVLPVSLKKH